MSVLLLRRICRLRPSVKSSISASGSGYSVFGPTAHPARWRGGGAAAWLAAEETARGVFNGHQLFGWRLAGGGLAWRLAESYWLNVAGGAIIMWRISVKKWYQ